MLTSTILAAGALAFAASSHAHMIMNTPTPYGLKDLQTSPLNGKEYQFPCQSGSRTDAFDADGASNPMTVGQDNDLKFTGSAVHGGGSCQLSVTYEYPPPADKTKWKVIHSFIGSCPAQAVGNLETPGQPPHDGQGRPTGPQCTSDNQTECLKDFKWQLPKGMKNGNATLAWTWFNKIGNREMYMNCAPISISGGSDDTTVYDALPEIFVANIPGECTTDLRGGVLGFPNPGAQVTYGEAVDPAAIGACAAGSSNGSSSAASGSSGTTTVQSTTMLVQATPVTSTPAAVATSAASSAYTYPSSASNGSTGSTGSSANSSTSNGTSSGTCESTAVSCTSPGNVVCIGTTQFGICDINMCAIPQTLAAGTTCSSGVVSKRDHVRRSIRAHRHMPAHEHKFF